MNPILFKKPRHKWFSSPTKGGDCGWYGPCDTMEKAIMECAAETEDPIFVTQGRKLTKIEIEDLGADYDWECDVQNAIEVRVKNK